MNSTIGIDLGSSFSRVSVWNPETQSVRIIGTYPSTIFFSEEPDEDGNQQCFFGDELAIQVDKPFNTISGVTRLVGMKKLEFDTNLHKNLYESRIRFPNTDDNEEVSFSVKFNGRSKNLSAVDVVSRMMLKLKEIAEAELGYPLNGVVLSVPTFFSDFQRRVMKQAAKNGGFTNVWLLNQTSAGAIDHGVDLVLESEEKNLFVFDLGGGSLSVSIVGVKIVNDMLKFKVKSVAGNPCVGGKDIDDAIMGLCINQFFEDHKLDDKVQKVDFMWDQKKEAIAKSLSKLRVQCEMAKKNLSNEGIDKVTIQLDSFYEKKNLVYALSRESFENVCDNLIKKCRQAIRECLVNAKIDQHSGIHKIILVGGSTKIPGIKKLLKSFFFEFEELLGPIEEGVIPEQSVVRGAAIMAFVLGQGEMVKRVSNNSLEDVTAFDIGIECSRDGIHTSLKTLIPRNTTIPTTEIYKCTTAQPQPNAEIHVYEGLYGWQREYKFLGIYNIMNTSYPAPARDITLEELVNTAPIEANFQIDENGILSGYGLHKTNPLDWTVGHEGRLCPVRIEKGRFPVEYTRVMVDSNKRARAEDAGNESANKRGK